MKMRKLVVIGSARIDAYLDLPDKEAEGVCDLDTQDCFIKLSYAAKIPLKSVYFSVGGNGANVAIGTKRLGVDSVLVAELGIGIFADFARKELEKEIEITYVSQSPNIQESFGTVLMYQGERTILSYYSPLESTFPSNLEPAEWCYLTSTGENFENYFEDAYLWIEKFRPKLVFNPGGRQISKGKDWLAKYLSKTDLIFINRQEAEEIVQIKDTYGREKNLLAEVGKLGPEKVVITDGMDGAYAYDGVKFYHCPVFPIDAIERTGAGDAFSSGALAALILGKSLQEALLWGTLNSASVISFVGPQRGLIKSGDLSKWFERADSVGLKTQVI